MKILAVDTSSQGCSVAVVESKNILAEFHVQNRETHSKHLLTAVDSVLDASGLDISGIDGFAVAIGPGSFTGLRIGISTIKGLAAATGKPVAGVSSLEALACGVPYCEEQICTMIDARKNEVYAAFFRYVNHEMVRLTEETAVSPLALAEKLNEPTMVVGTGVEVYKQALITAGRENVLISSAVNHSINAVNVAILGGLQFKKEGEGNMADLVPNYIRKSDAEIHRKNAES